MTTGSFDIARDRPASPPAFFLAEDALVVVDGCFLQKPELAPAWDVLLYLKVSAPEARRRGIARDTGTLGDLALVTTLYDLRYEPAFVRYEKECRPEERADFVIDNENPSAPWLYR